MTIKEIARIAGVSTGTVDRVIHNRGKVDPQKKIVIEKIIRECGYTPNVYAQNLKRVKDFKVGYLTPLLSSEDGYWNLVYKGVRHAHEDLGNPNFRICVYEYDRFSNGSFLNAGTKMVNDGILACVMIAKPQSEAKKLIQDNPSLKYVLLDSEVEGANPISTIGQDAIMGGRLAGRILCLLSKAPKCFLTFSFRTSQISSTRLIGFMRYCQERNINVMATNIDQLSDIQKVVKKAMEGENKIDGIFVPFFGGFIVANELNKLVLCPDIPIVAYDLLSSNRKALINGDISCLLSQRPIYQGYASIWQIYNSIVLGLNVEKKVEVQVDVLFKENLPLDYLDENTRTDSFGLPQKTELLWAF